MKNLIKKKKQEKQLYEYLLETQKTKNKVSESGENRVVRRIKECEALISECESLQQVSKEDYKSYVHKFDQLLNI